MDDSVDVSTVADGWLVAVVGFVDFSIVTKLFSICCRSTFVISVFSSLRGREVVNATEFGKVHFKEIVFHLCVFNYTVLISVLLFG
jgi:hypothetical protein